MKVLLAGATGAIGRPLTRMLHDAGHQVVALSRGGDQSRALVDLDVEPIVADALDRDALLRATRGLRLDAVIHELTALRKPPAGHGGMAATNQLRTSGTRNLLAVAHETGATRFVTQSMVFGYGYVDHGDEPLTEASPFGRRRGGPSDRHIEAMVANERLVLEDPSVEGIALRYGLFYGADVQTARRMLERRSIPVARGATHPLSWVHIEDAASATLAALERGRPGAYNVVDDSPTSWARLYSTLAEAIGAPAPFAVPGWALRLAAPYLATMVLDTSMRVSNAKARAELGWEPEHPDFTRALGAYVAAGV